MMQLLDKLRIVGQSKPTQRNGYFVKNFIKLNFQRFELTIGRFNVDVVMLKVSKLQGCMIQNLIPIYTENWDIF